MTLLAEDISRNILARQTTQYFVNGAPASGKSTALKQLATDLPSRIPGIIVFGPFSLQVDSMTEYCQWIADQFLQACFLDEMPTISSTLESVAETWNWLSEHIEASGKTFVILLDIKSDYSTDSHYVADFFSALRSLDPTDYKRTFRLHHVLVGYWDHIALEKHYRDINISFPYTVGHNYRLWGGIDVDDVIDLIPTSYRYRELYGRTLHELTDGHAGIIQEILPQLNLSSLEFARLLAIVDKLALSGQTTERLVTVWNQLPAQSLGLIEQLLLYRSVLIRPSLRQYERYLETAGLALSKRIGANEYLYFKSWYSELVVRYHSAELKLSNKELGKTKISDISPQIHAINFEAYRLICDIETSARNLVVTTLSHRKERGEDLLKDFYTQNDANEIQSLSERAMRQMEVSNSKGLNTTINPAIAYISTGELARVIRDIGKTYDLVNWHSIADAIKTVTPIRNAVMHNQLVDEKSLLTLYDLQERIHSISQPTK